MNSTFYEFIKLRELMKTIDRYMAMHTIGGVLLVLFLLIILFSFFEFLVQLNDVGKANYGVVDAFVFVGLTVPKRVVDLMALRVYRYKRFARQ
jgi:lipopolysaccharide export system permease protein